MLSLGPTLVLVLELEELIDLWPKASEVLFFVAFVRGTVIHLCNYMH